jgi:hypothetical protein
VAEGRDIDQTIGEDLEITRVQGRRSAGGAWVHGKVHGHKFEALVFAEHADEDASELRGSRIAKLWIRRIADGKEVFCWDRGVVTAAADETAEAVVGFLCEGLASVIFPPAE